MIVINVQVVNMFFKDKASSKFSDGLDIVSEKKREKSIDYKVFWLNPAEYMSY